MGADSKIEWTDHTFNPWWGCQRVSPGCEHCYAETFSHRLGRDLWGAGKERRIASDRYWREPIAWDREAVRARKRRRVFCASMADVFEDRADLVPHRRRLWELIEATQQLDWLLLTKRPENILPILERDMQESAGACSDMVWRWRHDGSPPANVWLGTTIEDQRRAEQRVPLLIAAPAAVRFLSAEPLLERVDVIRAVGKPDYRAWDLASDRYDLESDPEPDELAPACEVEGDAVNYGNELVDNPEHAEWGARRLEIARIEMLRGVVDWVIIGGESGPGARPFGIAWARALLEQTRIWGAAPFVKQMGAMPMEFRKGNGGVWDGELIRLGQRDRKGGDWSEWPEDLRVREFPR